MLLVWTWLESTIPMTSEISFYCGVMQEETKMIVVRDGRLIESRTLSL
jgi:hypothetical protein